MSDSDGRLTEDMGAPNTLAETLAQKPVDFDTASDPDEIDTLPIPTMLPQILQTSSMKESEAFPRRRGKEGPHVTVAAPDSNPNMKSPNALPHVHVAARSNDSAIKRGVSFQDLEDGPNVTLSQSRCKRPNYTSSSTFMLRRIESEPRRQLPTASYGAEKVLLPTAKVLTKAMEKASSRLPPQKANIQESVHAILSKLSSKDPSSGSATQRQREANSSFMHKEMSSVLQARRSQKEMLEFQAVLERMEEEVAQRRRAHRRALDIAPSTGVVDDLAAMNMPLDDSSDEEEGEDDDVLLTVREEKERLRSLQTSSAVVQRISEREARRWLETQKQVIENPGGMNILHDELQESAARLRAARTSRRRDLPGKKLMLEGGGGGEYGGAASATALPSEQDISWVSLPSEPRQNHPNTPERSAHMGGDGSSNRWAGMPPTGSISTVHTTADEPRTPPPPQAPPTEAQLQALLQRGNGRSIYGVDKVGMTQKERAERENQRRQRRQEKMASPKKASIKSDDSESSRPVRGKKEVHFASSLTNSAALLSPAAKSAPSPPPSEEPKTPPKKHHSCGALKRHTEPLPAAPGVGDRSAALLRHSILSLRRRTISAEMQCGQDVRRTCRCMAQLFPLRVALLEQDLFGMYDVTHPSQWDAKYRQREQRERRRSSAHGPSQETSPLSRAKAAAAAATQEEMDEGRTNELEEDQEASKTNTEADISHSQMTAASTMEVSGTTGSPLSSNRRAELAERSKKNVHVIDPSERPSDLSPGSLQSPSPPEGHHPTTEDSKKFLDPGVMLEKHRRAVFRTAQRMDDEERKTACLAFIDCLEALSKDRIAVGTWPSAAAAFEQCRHYLREESYRQNFDGFTTLVHENFPVEQLVQWPVQEMLRRLAAVFFVSPNEYRDWMAGLYQKMSNTHDYEGRFRAVDCTIKNKDIPTEAHIRITLHRCRKLPRVDTTLAVAQTKTAALKPKTPSVPEPVTGSTLELDALAEAETSSKTEPGVVEQQIGSPVADGAAVEESTSRMPEGSPIPEALGQRPATRQGFDDPDEDHDSEKLVHIPEYAVRLSAERQVMTSSAVPAGNSPTGSAGGEEQSAAGREEASNSVTARQRVYFYDQTFKLHLYDVASVISVDLLSDGLLVSSGSFSIERYLHWRRSSIWLPLMGKFSRRTELQLTIEVL